MIKEDNAALVIDGKTVTGETEFTAYKSEMDVEVVFTFDGTDLGGKSLVTFEELEDVTNPEEPEKVAEHKDIDDEGQTVKINTRNIEIHTNATGVNGEKKFVANDEDVTIVDTVTLKNLEVGKEYVISGYQMIKEDNAELLINNEMVTGEYKFTADSADMEVKVEFTFNAKDLGDKSLVTFEELRVAGKDEPIAEHKDINDEGQTVKFTKPVEETEETPTSEVSTGITDTTIAWTILGISCVAVMLIVLRKKKNI